jgi:hypothetical protein
MVFQPEGKRGEARRAWRRARRSCAQARRCGRCSAHARRSGGGPAPPRSAAPAGGLGLAARCTAEGARRLAELRSVLLLLVRELRRELLPTLPCTAQLGLNSTRHLTRRGTGMVHCPAATIDALLRIGTQSIYRTHGLTGRLRPEGGPAAGPLAAGSARLAAAAAARARRARWRAPAPPSPGTYKCSVRCNAVIDPTCMQRTSEPHALLCHLLVSTWTVRKRAPLDARAGCRAARDTVPRGMPCRAGCRAARDAVPRGMPCRGRRNGARETSPPCAGLCTRMGADATSSVGQGRVCMRQPAAAHARAARRRCAAQPARP